MNDFGDVASWLLEDFQMHFDTLTEESDFFTGNPYYDGYCNGRPWTEIRAEND